MDLEKISSDIENLTNSLNNIVFENKESGIKKSGIIKKISVFSDREQAQKMRFYSKDEWDSLSELEKKQYDSESLEREYILKTYNIEEKLKDAIKEL